MRCSKCLFSPLSKLHSQPCCSQECQEQLSTVPRAVPSSHAGHGVHALSLAETRHNHHCEHPCIAHP